MVLKCLISLAFLFSIAANRFCFAQNLNIGKPSIDSLEFVYPLTVGTTWLYKYYFLSNSTTGVYPPDEQRHGSQIWEVVSFNQSLDTTTYQITCAKIDTVMRRNGRTNTIDTTIENKSIQFSITTLPNSIYVYWDSTVRLGHFGSIPIPKYLPAGQNYFYVTDMVVAGATYVSGLGLKNYESSHYGNSTWDEKLNLVLFNSEPLSVESNVAASKLPKLYFLGQNYPNPFNPTTIIQYVIPCRALVNLTVLDIVGREISTLVNEQKEAGIYSISFDASQFTTGIYFYRIRAGDFLETRKMLLLK